jgi:hypothetical protein
MDADNGALSLDSAVELLRIPEGEQAQPEEQTADIEQPEEPADQTETTETEAEEQVTEEADVEEQEPATPAVEPPAFYTKAEKEAFASLPPEQQQSIARLAREGERHTAKISQEIAAERKAIADAKAAIEQERAQYQQALLANFPQAPDPRLIDSDPVEYLRQDAMYKQAVQQWQAAEHQRQQEVAEQQAQEQAQREEHIRTQAERLKELLPEIGDPVEGPKLATALMKFGNEVGFDNEALSNADAEELVILHDAMKWRAAQASAKAAKAKPVPKVAAPGVGRTKAEMTADQRKSALARLERTGTIEDAVALLRN